MAEQDRPPRAVVRTGSIAEYGTGPLPYREDQHEEPATPYAGPHVIGTEQLRRSASILHFPVVTVRMEHGYGPGQERKTWAQGKSVSDRGDRGGHRMTNKK